MDQEENQDITADPVTTRAETIINGFGNLYLDLVEFYSYARLMDEDSSPAKIKQEAMKTLKRNLNLVYPKFNEDAFDEMFRDKLLSLKTIVD